MLCDATGDVVRVQAVGAPSPEAASLAFSAPRSWRPEFTQSLKEAGRFQPVTLPALLAAGAEQFCWISPGEAFTYGTESWSPATHGAFLYLMRDANAPLWFPCEAPRSESTGRRAAAAGAPAVDLRRAGRRVAAGGRGAGRAPRGRGAGASSVGGTGGTRPASTVAAPITPASMPIIDVVATRTVPRAALEPRTSAPPGSGGCSSTMRAIASRADKPPAWTNPLAVGKADSAREWSSPAK